MEPVVDGQQSLFSEQEMDQLQDPDISVTEVTEKKIKQVVRHRKAKQSGQRTTFLDGLPQVEEVIPLKAKDSILEIGYLLSPNSRFFRE